MTPGFDNADEPPDSSHVTVVSGQMWGNAKSPEPGLGTLFERELVGLIMNFAPAGGAAEQDALETGRVLFPKKMPPKRKRGAVAHEAFDPNKSDSEDENFEPELDQRPTSRRSKTSRSQSRKTPSRKKSRGYRGSDIDSDDDAVSESEDDFPEQDDNAEDDEFGETATGRRRRKAAAVHNSYKESSGSDSSESEEPIKEEGTTPKKKRSLIVKVKNPGSIRPTRGRVELAYPPPSSRRATRARTAEVEGEDEFVELSTSGRHAVRASKSPEIATRRPSRAVKGLKAPETIAEATQESGSPEKAPAEEQEDLDEDEVPMVTGDVEMANASPDEEAQVLTKASEVADQGDDEEKRESIEADEDDEEDEGPITRRTRASRRSPDAEAQAEAAAEPEAEEEGPTRSGRLTRTRKSSRARKNAQEVSSDFEPGNDSDEGSASEKPEKGEEADDDEDESSSRSRTRRSTRSKRGSKRPREESADELELDQEELAEELHELKSSRPSRRRRSPSIQYEASKRRRTVREVNYAIQSIPPLNPADDEDEVPVQTPARGGRRGGRNGTAGWDRVLNTTYGPFGGGGAGAILGGPWGTGATGGVETDSSDDEMPERANAGGNVGMTPTTGTAPGLMAGGGAPPFAANATPNLGKIKNQKALADADPLGVDMSVDFSKVGGLKSHIDQLKEMVQLPLLYPELFTRFHVTPPRGVLFHGPPGTGKTLLARALANSIGHNGRKITFYMRKGADALSKWVGEAEKQLRLLFEEARKNQPSIIFFDEIDGLAPVRSSKQEQIHASIVSTLLALMDGMDGRGQVIVIGATNRPDNIDPALRRPGRFDREFYFPLPDVDARMAILDIHTRDWGLSPQFKKSLAERTKGYGGADIRALCTEAALNSIQRTYPQIYSSKDKLVVDPTKISIHATDFSISIKKMVPSSERSASSSAAPLPKSIESLLKVQLESVKKVIDTVLPRKKKVTALEEAMYEPYEDEDHGFGREAMFQEFERARIFRPRLILGGMPGMGQNYLASAVLHYLEGVHVQSFDLPTLMADGQPPEQVLVRLFAEVKRAKPSIIYIPDVDVWHATLSAGATLLTFRTMLRSLPPTDPILVLGTCECEIQDLPPEVVKDIFGFSKRNRFEIPRPTGHQRHEYFSGLLTYLRKSPAEYPDPANRKKRVLEALPVAPPPPPRETTKAELKAELKADRQMLNYLKIQLQPIMDQVNRKYKKFRQPVIPFATLGYLFDEQDPNYVRPDVANAIPRPYEIVADKDGSSILRESETGKTFHNLETTTIEERLSNGFYARPKDFLKDIRSLAKDAKNIGDRERTLKANELEANVEVDVGTIEANSRVYNWDALFARQLQRAKREEEKARKRKAMASVLGLAQSDVNNDSDAGPVTLGAPVPRTTTARFLPIGGSPAPLESSNPTNSTKLTNGTSVPSRRVEVNPADEDTQMTDSPMGPPSQWPMTHPRTLPESARATAGNTQVSQRSALTSLPPGVDPENVVNEASTTQTTTKPSDNSHRTSEGWTQRTNGLPPQSQYSPEQQHSQIPDTQPMSGGDDLWIHSQARDMVPHHFDMDTSPSSSQHRSSLGQSGSHRTGGGPTSHAAASLTGLLNNPVPGVGSGSKQGNSQPHSHPSTSLMSSNDTSLMLRHSNAGDSSSGGASQPTMMVNEKELEQFVETAASMTTGCSVEQLEQIYREMMDEIWRQRDQWNRVKTLQDVTNVFNDVIKEMEDEGVLGSASQDVSAL
ncbi:hypothetical protein MKZ38_010363 [Zalerion maritima]|uniref:AAA+ ATPase domain-containing protein n=1 Tax=Zalerion maritima TaxID=339359 RepID=A0AAD5WVV3_9PEZI|nr:hypothetical protein MKZ38_010363 [Zalerion maritima]